MRIRPLVAIGLVALAACSAREEEDSDDLDFDATDWSTTLTSRAGTSVGGSATARSVGLEGGSGTSTSTVIVSNATPMSHHPWHVHSGTCATGGPIVGEANDYPMLDIGADGSARATAAIGANLSDQTRYHVNVHRSASDMTVIACGDLVD